MDYHEGMSRAIDIQAHIRALEEDFPELVAIDTNSIQIEWDAFSALFPNDVHLEKHFINECYEHKRGRYNGAYIIACRKGEPDEA